MNTHDMLLTFKTLELLTKGVDMNNLNSESDIKNSYFNKDNKLISRLSEGVEDFYFILDDELRQYLSLDHKVFKRCGKYFSSIIEDLVPEDAKILKDVTKEIFLSAVQQVYLKGICEYRDLYLSEKDPDFITRNLKLDEGYDASIAPNSMIQDLSRDKTDFYLKILLAVCYWDTPDLLKRLYEFDKSEKDWSILKQRYPNAQIVDDRMYIPVKPSSKQMCCEGGKDFEGCDYIVISKNLYDYFFCSYGSAHQSCYSLSSPHRGFYGMFPMILSDNHYIVYGTKDHAQKVTVGGTESKYPAPYMFFRTWGWMSAVNKLLIDKVYSTLYNINVDKFLELNDIPITNNSIVNLKDGNKYVEIFSKWNCRFYPDSLRLSKTDFCRGNGIRSFVGDKPWKCISGDYSNIIDTLSRNTVDPNLNLYQDICCYENKILNPKRCAITNLIISNSEDVHWLANVVKKPCSSLLALEWIDGYFKLLTSSTPEIFQGREHIDINTKTTDMLYSFKEGSALGFTYLFSKDTIPLQTLKTYIQNYRNELEYDMVVLRVVDKNQINFIKYANKKGD